MGTTADMKQTFSVTEKTNFINDIALIEITIIYTLGSDVGPYVAMGYYTC